MSELCPDEAAPSRTPRRVPFTDARRIAPARRFCRACHRDKTGASFAPGETRCRKCVRDEVEITEPRPASRKRLCIVCGDHRSPARFERHNGAVAETCDLCSTDPDIRVTLKQEDAAAIVLRRLRQIAAGRTDEASTCPTLGARPSAKFARAWRLHVGDDLVSAWREYEGWRREDERRVGEGRKG